MVGSGTHVFAVMGYVIAHAMPDREVGGQVRLNPKLLGTIFGESEERIQEAIDYLCKPDPKSTTPDEEGRRLVQVGQFDYRVVNAAKYFAIRNEEARREANRTRQANWRNRKTVSEAGPKHVEHYDKGRVNVKKKKPLTLRAAEILGRKDGIAEALDQAQNPGSLPLSQSAKSLSETAASGSTPATILPDEGLPNNAPKPGAFDTSQSESPGVGGTAEYEPEVVINDGDDDED